jgi:hypothetical protein
MVRSGTLGDSNCQDQANQINRFMNKKRKSSEKKTQNCKLQHQATNTEVGSSSPA